MPRFAKKVSIVIPAHNAAAHLRRVLPLYHCDDDTEVIVVANGCTDDTATVAQRLLSQAQVVELPVGSVAIARDVGVSLAQGEYLAFRDADDEPVDFGLENLVTSLDENRELDIVCGRLLWVEDGSAHHYSDYLKGHDSLYADCVFRAPFHLASSLARTEQLRRLPSTPLYSPAQDWAYLWSAFKAGLRMETFDYTGLRYIRNSQSTTGVMSVGNTLDDFVTKLRSQFLAECGVFLTAEELLLFVNIAPCAYWAYGDVPYLKSVEDLRGKAAALLRKVVSQNQRLPSRALKERCQWILAELDKL